MKKYWRLDKNIVYYQCREEVNSICYING